ncbi:MAG TPA: hypothetical protein VGD67_12050 [Pseudonocardiaceae bacterium]
MDARARLAAAVARRDETTAAADLAREQLYAVIREVADELRQTEIVIETGYTREHVRRIARGATS